MPNIIVARKEAEMIIPASPNPHWLFLFILAVTRPMIDTINPAKDKGTMARK